MEGKQVPDIVCFNSCDLSDEINLANSQPERKSAKEGCFTTRPDDVIQKSG